MKKRKILFIALNPVGVSGSLQSEVEPMRLSCRFYLLQRLALQLFVFDNAVFEAHFGAQFKLRFYEGQYLSIGFQERSKQGENIFKTNKRQVHYDPIHRSEGQGSNRQLPHIRLLQ